MSSKRSRSQSASRGTAARFVTIDQDSGSSPSSATAASKMGWVGVLVYTVCLVGITTGLTVAVLQAPALRDKLRGSDGASLDVNGTTVYGAMGPPGPPGQNGTGGPATLPFTLVDSTTPANSVDLSVGGITGHQTWSFPVSANSAENFVGENTTQVLSGKTLVLPSLRGPRLSSPTAEGSISTPSVLLRTPTGGLCTPWAVKLAAAGSGGSNPGVTGADAAGTITIVGGTSPTSGAMAKITFCNAYTNKPFGVILLPANQYAASLTTPAFVDPSLTTAQDFTITASSSGMATGFPYVWLFYVIPASPTFDYGTSGALVALSANSVSVLTTTTPVNSTAVEVAYAQGNATARGNTARVAFIGDGTTYDWQTSGNATWGALFANAPYNAVNLGVPGDRTQNLLARLANNLAALGPQCTRAVLLIGTNNIADGAQSSDIQQGIRKIVATMQSKIKRILLLWILPRFDGGSNQTTLAATRAQTNSDMRPQQESIAQGINVLSVDNLFLSHDANPLQNTTVYQADGFHLNPLGYTVLARPVLEWLRQTEY